MFPFHVDFPLYPFLSIKAMNKMSFNEDKKIGIGNLLEIALNLYTALGDMAILTMLILAISEYGISFSLIVS